jgi:DNA-directed RNA polymerase specialized sigma24 family protein
MSNKNITRTQSFFGEKIFPLIQEVYNYAFLMSGDEQIAEKQLLHTCKEAAWFSEYLSPETDIRLWLLRIMMKIVEINNSNNTDSSEQSSIDQKFDLSENIREYIEQEGQYATTKKLEATISKLPYKLKQTTVLIDHLHFNYEQAADLIDIPEGAVVTRLFDARKLLLINLISELTTVFSNEKPNLKYKDKKIIVLLSDNPAEEKNNIQDKSNIEGEITTQQYLKSLFEKYLAQQSTRQAITEKIIYKYAPHLKDKMSSDNSPGRKNLITGVTIIMIILATLLILFYRPEITNPVELEKKQQGKNNVLIQLEKNYALLIKNKFDSLKFDIQSETIDKQLNKVVPEYKPVFLTVSGLYPKEYFITSYYNHKLINLVYKNIKDKILYTYQVPQILVGKGKPFALSEDLINYLNSENCFAARIGETTFLLKIANGNILGVAGQNLDRELLAGICNQ